jgi:hypothetical protein
LFIYQICTSVQAGLQLSLLQLEFDKDQWNSWVFRDVYLISLNHISEFFRHLMLQQDTLTHGSTMGHCGEASLKKPGERMFERLRPLKVPERS